MQEGTAAQHGRTCAGSIACPAGWNLLRAALHIANDCTDALRCSAGLREQQQRQQHDQKESHLDCVVLKVSIGQVRHGPMLAVLYDAERGGETLDQADVPVTDRAGGGDRDVGHVAVGVVERCGVATALSDYLVRTTGRQLWRCRRWQEKGRSW